MASVINKGQAAIEGVAGTFSVIVALGYPQRTSQKLTQNWEEEIIKDDHGYDASWLLRNEHFTQDISVRLIASSSANAIAAAAAIVGSPQLKVTLSGFTAAAFNGDWHTIPGCELTLENDKAGSGTLKLRRYADATQNTAATTTPS